MVQETAAQWGLRSCPPPLSLADRLFIFLMLVVLLIGALKLFLVSRMARSSRRSVQRDPASYEGFLQGSAQSLLQWLFVPFFAWGLLAAQHLYQMCMRLLVGKTIPTAIPLSILGELFVQLELCILVSFSLFLVRWHVVNRLGKLRC